MDEAFVGRANELQHVVRRLGELETARRGGLIFVGGEAGIGKTSLVERALRARQSAGAVAVARCLDGAAAAPYGPWQDVAAALREQVGGRPLAWGSWSAHDPQAPALTLVQALLDWLGGCVPAPVIVLEDLQWADPATLDVVRLLAARLPQVPSLILMTYRTDELHHSHPLWKLLPDVQRYGADRILLARLRAPEVQAIVARWVEDPDLAARAGPIIFRRCQGVPLFAHELARQVARDGMVDARRLPDTVLQAIDSRLDRLSSAVQELLEPAAVMGEQVSVALLEAVADKGEDLLAKLLQEPGVRQVLRMDASADLLVFEHNLVREAVLARMSPARRRHWHRRVADTLLHAASPDLDAVAHHLAEAEDPRAVEALLRAGTHAYRVGAMAQAETRWQAALDRAGENHPDRAEILLKLACVWRWTDLGRAEQCLVEAARTAAGRNQRAVSTWAQHHLALLAQQRNFPVRQQMETLLAQEEALLDHDEYLRLENDLFGETAGWARIAVPYSVALAIDGAREQAEAVLRPVAQRAATQLAPDVDYARLTLSFLGGHYADMPGWAMQASHRSLLLGNYRAAVLFKSHELLFTLLLTPTDRTRVDRLEQELQGLEDEALRRAGRALVSPPYSAVGIAQYLTGRWREARRNLVECALAERESAPDAILVLGADLLLEEGDLERAREVASWLAPRHPADPAPFGTAQALAHGIKARIAAALDDEVTAQAWLDGGRRQPTADKPMMAADLLTTAALLAERAGRLDEAARLAGEGRAVAMEVPLWWYVVQAGRVEIRALAAGGRADDAEKVYQSMQSMAHNASYLGLEALLTWDRAQWASRADERSEAARHASALFHRMGSPQLARASAAAAEGQAAPGPWVTVREREGGRMVAEGLTDREIADRLGISPRTVDRHLRNLFQKLQVSNRAALAAHVVRRHWA